jgi:hypothetical protein
MLNILSIDPSTIYITIAAIIVLILQLILCFKVKKTFVKFIPLILSFVATLIFVILLLLSEGWDVLGYLILALFSGGLFLDCGLGLIIWKIIIKVRKNK